MEKKKNNDLYNTILCVLSDVFKKWQIILFVVLACGISFDIFKTLTYTPMYTSTLTASLTVKDNSYTNLEQVQSYIETLNYMFNGDVVKTYVADKMNVKDVDYTCHISSISETNIVNIELLSDSKKEAFFASKYVVSWYKKNMKKLNFKYRMDVTKPASISTVPVNENSHFTNFKKAGILSAVVVIAILGLISFFSDRIKVAKDIERNVDSRLLRKIPREVKPRGKKFWLKNKKAILISSIQTSFSYKEAMKKLRTQIEESAHKHNYKTIMITSALENEGKSSIAANLAIALANKDYKILLVDADIRKPSMNKIFENSSKKCLNNYLNNKATWNSQIEHLHKVKCDVMFIQQDLDNAESLFESDQLKAFFDEAKELYDFVIVDSSPSCSLNEPLILNAYMDATMIVVKQNMATTKMINNTIHRLVTVKNNVIGCVYNAAFAQSIHGKKTYGYRYGYGRYAHDERRR